MLSSKLQTFFGQQCKGKTHIKFLACRKFRGISALNSEVLRWLDRTANSKIHDTTKVVPKRAFVEEQKP